MAEVTDTIAYAVKNRDESVRMASRSGGVFTAISDLILDIGGVVYGVRLNEDLDVVHAKATTKEERDSFRGSKYVQSRVGTAFQDCREDLLRGLPVLFSGTPCQIDGLQHFLTATKTPMDNLLTAEVLCHGVPSPRVYRDYLAYVGRKGKVTSFDFRDKKNFGWRDHVETIQIGRTEVSSRHYTDLFYGHNMLRPSCFQCPYKQAERYADITMGDYWGIDELDKAFNDDRGVSLVLTSTEKGKKWFKNASSALQIEEFPFVNSVQGALSRNYREPASRAQFWKDYETMPFAGIVKKYGVNRKNAMIRFVKKVLGRR